MKTCILKNGIKVIMIEGNVLHILSLNYNITGLTGHNQWRLVGKYAKSIIKMVQFLMVSMGEIVQNYTNPVP